LTAHLSFRVVADTPPPFSYDTARVSKRMLPSPYLERLGRWSLSFTRLRLRSLSLRPGNLLTLLYRALSMGFKRQRFPHLLPSKLHGFGFLPWRDLHPQVCAALRWARQDKRPGPKMLRCSFNLLLNAAWYRRFRHASGIFAATDLDDRRI
jgi:hypothetical protein